MDQGVELLLGLLVLVSLSCDSDAHFTGDVPDASGPDLSVEQWVNAHLLHTAKSTFDKVLLHPYHKRIRPLSPPRKSGLYQRRG